jgi:Staphylococcal nuclease homologue
MLKRGLATVYEAKSGVEFGGKEHERRYREAEMQAKARRQGLWKDFWRHGGVNFESPREYKTRMGLEQPLEVASKSSSERKKPGLLASLASKVFSSRAKTKKKQ